MSKFVVYSNTNGQVWNVLDQYSYEEDGTLAGGINGTNTLRYHASTNPAILEISDEDFDNLNINNLNNYVVVDRTIIEKPEDENYVPGESILEDKLIRFDIDCTNTIYAGTNVTLSDGNTYHFSLTEKDKSNLLGLLAEILMGATQVEWHSDNHDEPCKYYSAEDFQTIISTLTFHKKYNITYYRDLCRYVRTLTDDEIKDINYGDPIPNEFKSDVLKGYETKINSLLSQ